MRLTKRIAAVVLVLSVGLLLSGFRPFTPVQSVCPKCPVKGDRVTMKNNKIVVARVIGKNQDGYVLERHGELRFVQFREIKRVQFATGAEPKGIQNYDQILIKNKEQTLLHGTLIAIEAGKPLALKSVRGHVYMVGPKQVLVYYHRGRRRAPKI
jgi:hypothetical protein